MGPQDTTQTGPPSILDHDLNQYFPELLKFESTPEMESSELYAKIRPEVERILNAVAVEELSVLSSPPYKGGVAPASGDGVVLSSEKIKALAWNLERGIRFDGILDALKNHEKLKDKDLLLLTELDHGMARSGNHNVAQEIARELRLNYAFAPVYVPLQKGNGVEADMDGENTVSIHGLAMFSRYRMTNIHTIRLPNGKDKMLGKEKRLGYLRALFADIEHPAGMFRAVTVHLDALCSRAHRHRQIKLILDHLDTLPPLPTIIGGDWNTTTYNSQNAPRAILGYWRRVMMGVKNVVKNHLPHPDRYFERRLFNEIESRGYDYKGLNEIGVGTLHYDIASVEKNANLRDWVPEWCMWFIFWAVRRVGGRVSARLDWFAGKGLKIADGTSPQTIGELVDAEGFALSDHDAIALDFRLDVKQ